ncbi:hypothetical protein SBOR_3628 [Sclerotinia borealis F-4128]|uniref:DUF7729 domain-containing protein n=1 Tax=Sclerotinia borealis (strain F-4128) TaxID=1432307 RepID=W9CJA1_SCLBF|nr:hypothetical protein SBOR_3628 [Sclerotinia borealis F-4128]
MVDVNVRDDAYHTYVPELFASTLARLARSGTILVDQRPDPLLQVQRASMLALAPPFMSRDVVLVDVDVDVDDEEVKDGNVFINDLNQELRLQLQSQSQLEGSESESNFNPRKRNPEEIITSTATILPPISTPSTSTSPTSTSASQSSTSTSTLASSDTSSGLASAATGTTANLPTPFDSGFTSNITASCSSFMMSFLANETFKACLPFSLLLQNSNSFFQATKSLVRITQTLSASCSASPLTCNNLMTTLAANISTPSTCAPDLLALNPLVTQARLGLLAYSTLYTASCLQDPSSGAYCYAQAVTNASSPTDSYIYYLPLNVSLPDTAQPSCNTCLRNTMKVFEQAGSVRSSAVAGDYVEAAERVNGFCGEGFVNASLPVATVLEGGGGRLGVGLEGVNKIYTQNRKRSRSCYSCNWESGYGIGILEFGNSEIGNGMGNRNRNLGTGKQNPEFDQELGLDLRIGVGFGTEIKTEIGAYCTVRIG